MTSSLFIAVPVYSGKVRAFESSMERLKKSLTRCGIQHSVVELWGESLITRARNKLVNTFRKKSDFTHFMFIDSDIEFSPADVLRLLHSGHDFCAAPYPAKAIGTQLIGNPQVKDGCVKVVNGWAEGQDLPTGFMIISRTIFDKLAPFVPEVDDDVVGSGVGAYHNFFDCGVDGRQYLSEDWWFSRLCGLHGIQPWLDTKAKLKHWGMYGYSCPSLEEQWEAAKKKQVKVVEKVEIKYTPQILYSPWLPGRSQSLLRIGSLLGDIRTHECKGSQREFMLSRWYAASNAADAAKETHVVMFDDDALFCPQHARERLDEIIKSKPREIIALHNPCVDSLEAMYAKEKWVTSDDATIGSGVIFPLSVFEEFLVWINNNLKEGALDAANQFGMDALYGMFAVCTKRLVYHPIPTIMDQDTKLVSSQGNEDTPGRNTVCNWRDGPIPESYDDDGPHLHMGRWFPGLQALIEEWVK